MRTAIAPFLAFALAAPAAAQDRPGSPANAGVSDFDMPRPIDAVESVWIQDLTWLEVRDALRAGKTTAIVPTGGIEQNGPYLVTAKHDIIITATAEAIARKLGDALVTPVVSFVPEGSIDPPDGMMRFPGTIGVREETFEALLTDIAASLHAHGFTTIVLIGDSGGNQAGMAKVAETLSARWSDARVLHIPEYYDWVDRQEWLKARGIHEVDEGIHDEFSAEAIMLSMDPASVRMDERIRAGKFTIHGVDLAPVERTIELAHGLIEHIATVTVDAIRQRM